MGWGMLWLFLVLKIPLLSACWLVWWAIHQEPDPDDEPADDGGSHVRPQYHPHPRLPRAPRRGPHGDQALPSPPRVRPVRARARTVSR
jgi:hypothetical protein